MRTIYQVYDTFTSLLLMRKKGKQA